MALIETILTLWSGSSCRSQRAEAIVNHQLYDTWQAASANASPAGCTHPKAIQVLAEIGIEHDEEITAVFHQVRDDIVGRLSAMLKRENVKKGAH